MVNALFNTFLFLTWGLGLIASMVAIGSYVTKRDLEDKEKLMDLEQREYMFEKVKSMTNSRGSKSPSLPTSPTEIPEKLRELMKSSPDHPEVEEIEPTDSIIGVKFEAADYPPGFGDYEDGE